MTLSFRHTRFTCYAGYITQAIIINLLPLLFIIFQTDYGMSYQKMGSLILINFMTQLTVDLLAIKFIDRLGFRGPMVAAHLLAAAGLVMLSFMPFVMPTYAGLVVAVVVYSMGGGLLEVVVSPAVDALPAPTEQKAAGMSLLHSFYCWGQVLVVLLTTLLLRVTGLGMWRLLPILWAIIPFINMFILMKVPFPKTLSESERQSPLSLFKSPVFWVFMVMMLCSGASELTISQWSSLFAERGLGVSKVWGDLAGPCLFAVMMGIGRTVFGVFGEKMKLHKVMAIFAGMAVVCYLVAALAASPVLSLLGCAICGLSVSMMWPGTFGLVSPKFPAGGAAMFAILALCGDAGCSLGPWLAGVVADRAASGLNAGILMGTVFPMLLLGGLLLLNKLRAKD